jgi:hypothetical protein
LDDDEEEGAGGRGVGGVGVGVGVGVGELFGATGDGEFAGGGGVGGAEYALLMYFAQLAGTGMASGTPDIGKFKVPAQFKPKAVGLGFLGSKGQSTRAWDPLSIQTTTFMTSFVSASHSIHALLPNFAESWLMNVSRSIVEPARMLFSVMTSCIKLKTSQCCRPKRVTVIAGLTFGLYLLYLSANRRQ